MSFYFLAQTSHIWLLSHTNYNIHNVEYQANHHKCSGRIWQDIGEGLIILDNLVCPCIALVLHESTWSSLHNASHWAPNKHDCTSWFLLHHWWHTHTTLQECKTLISPHGVFRAWTVRGAKKCSQHQVGARNTSCVAASIQYLYSHTPRWQHAYSPNEHKHKNLEKKQYRGTVSSDTTSSWQRHYHTSAMTMAPHLPLHHQHLSPRENRCSSELSSGWVDFLPKHIQTYTRCGTAPKPSCKPNPALLYSGSIRNPWLPGAP